METLFLYFGKMILVSAVMSAYYLLFLRDKTFHHYNRFYLIITVIISLLLPLLKVEYFTIETDSRFLLLLNQISQTSAKTTENAFNFWNFGAIVLVMVSVFLLAKILLGLLKINQIKKEFPRESIEGITFYNTNLHDAPFSFFRNLFWKNSILLNSDLGKQILKHEMVHIEQKHSIDKLFIQFIQSLFWFNPIFYFIKKEINLIHEYLADKKAVKQSDTRAFAQMLLASNFSGNVLPATSPFLSSNLKKRLKMITKTKTKYSYARRILALPILFVISFALLVNAKNTEIKKQNKEIAIAVKQLKQDTIKVEDIQKIAQSHQEKISKASEKLKKDNEKIATLSEETRKKSEELQKIAQEKGANSYEYELKAKELESLGNEIDKVTNSKDYQQNLQELGLKVEDYDKFFKSEEWKNYWKQHNELFKNLDYSKVKMPKLPPMPKMNMELPKIPDIPNLPEMNFDIQEKSIPPMNFEDFKWNEKTNLTKEEIKKLEKLSKQKAELAKQQAEIAKKQAEIARQQAEISRKFEQNNSWIISVDADKMVGENFSNEKTPYAMKFPNGNSVKLYKLDNGDNIVIKSKGKINVKGIEPNTKIYINGKLSSKEEMDKINPKDISTVNVHKLNNNGKEEAEIRVQTK